MVRAKIGLRRVPNDRSFLDRLPEGCVTIGLDGVLSSRSMRARSARVPGEGMDGFRWRLLDRWSQRWWPQGIAVGNHGGVPIALVSWYAQPKRERAGAARISIIDLSIIKRPRYWHVLLVEARPTPSGTVFDPVPIHAGGIVWAGDRLLAAATFGGIREFRLADILRLPGRTLEPGHSYALPQAAAYAPPPGDQRRLRFSFLGAETGDGDDSRLVAGEYDTGHGGRLARVRLTATGAAIEQVTVPGIPAMQGTALHSGVWFVSSSQGRAAGDLWMGTRGNIRRERALPPGPEDLAVWPERGELWSVTEWPGKRWVVRQALPAQRLT
jgi:hypothetical protein